VSARPVRSIERFDRLQTGVDEGADGPRPSSREGKERMQRSPAVRQRRIETTNGPG